MRELYIDANVFIIAATEESGNAFELLTKIRNGEIMAMTSVLTIDEVLWVLKKVAGKEIAAQIAKAMFIFPNLTLVDATKEIISDALQIFVQKDLRPRDSIHLATMYVKNISTIASNDADFDKIKGIKRLSV
ncbi:MAG: type II toxin-antitoxin system VapC family toxin [Candidatus Aenigmarchaeota archaeon]|nr:type II toxin-antitoxin system VapC family toxin [Candidatus Aenigmarchaeota archaeon]